MFRQYDRTALPVTDTAGMLIGIVTIDDVLDVAEATATREIQRIGGSEALDEPYMRDRVRQMVRKRAGWLTALFLGEMLTATAMGAFEAEIAKAVVLALFVPLIISSGGNSGSQAATLVIRALALGEVGVRDWWRVMRRELLAGLALGAILGSIGFLRIAVWSAFSDIYGAALVAGRADGGHVARRRRAVGDADGLAAAAPHAPPGLRSGGLVGAVRRHARGRDRARDLFLGRPRRLEGNVAVAQSSPEESLSDPAKTPGNRTETPAISSFQELFRNFSAHLQARFPIVKCRGCPVLDVIFVGISILFFVLSVGYVAVCDRLMK